MHTRRKLPIAPQQHAHRPQQNTTTHPKGYHAKRSQWPPSIIRVYPVPRHGTESRTRKMNLKKQSQCRSRRRALLKTRLGGAGFALGESKWATFSQATTASDSHAGTCKTNPIWRPRKCRKYLHQTDLPCYSAYAVSKKTNRMSQSRMCLGKDAPSRDGLCLIRVKKLNIQNAATHIRIHPYTHLFTYTSTHSELTKKWTSKRKYSLTFSPDWA